MIKRILLFLILFAWTVPSHAQGELVPWVQEAFANANGNGPLANGFVCTYAAGTTTPLSTYSDYTLTTPNQNPIRLNAAGRPSYMSAEVPVFLGVASYKFITYAAGTGNTCNGTSVGAAVKSVDNVFNLAQLQTLVFATKMDDKVCHASQYAGSTAGAKIAACIAALPSTGGTVDARGLEGAQTISVDVFSGVTKPGVLLLPAGTITLSTTQNVPSGWSIVGTGTGQTIINYTSATGNAFALTTSNYSQFEHFKLAGTSAGNSATGIRIVNASNYDTISDLIIDGFANNIVLTGSATGPVRPFSTKIIDTTLVNHTTCGICLDHAVDTFITNVLNAGVSGNATTAWGVTIDTGTSGVYINSMSMLYAGFRIRNSAPSAGTYDQPPEFVFADQLLSDSVTGTHGIYFDPTLSVVDAGSRRGKSYHFTNSWAAYTQTTDTDGVNVAGGDDISFTDFRARVNKRHGFHISDNGAVAPTNVRITNAAFLGNNQQNLATGAGLYIDGTVRVLQIAVNTCRSGNAAGEGTTQNYGIYLAAGASNQLQLYNCNVSGNVTAGISDNSSGGNKEIVGVHDFAASVVKSNYILGDKATFCLGDGNFCMDFNNASASNPIQTYDSGDTMIFNRSTSTFIWNVGSSPMMNVSSNGVDAVGYRVGAAVGTDATLSCGGGEAVKAITVVKGIVTGASCGPP